MIKIQILLFFISTMLVMSKVNAAEIYNKNGNKLYLYGEGNSCHYMIKNKIFDYNQTYTQFGFKGETKVNKQMTSYCQWEYQVEGNPLKNSQSLTHVALVGLKFANVGSIDYGRNHSITHALSSWTNVLPEFGDDIFNFNNYFQYALNNTVTYCNKNFFSLIDGLNLALQYQEGDKKATNSAIGTTTIKTGTVTQATGIRYGFSMIYNLNNKFSIGSVMASSSNRHTVDQNFASNYGTIYSSGLKYNIKNIYLAAQYSQLYNNVYFDNTSSKNDVSYFNIYKFINKVQKLKAVVQYRFDPKLHASVAYLKTSNKKIKNHNKHDSFKHVYLGASYYLNKHMFTFINYKVNLLSKKNKFIDIANSSNNNIIALGITYQF